ncbi:MAG: glycoside hydrolase family 97 protein [Bacteroidetes bacterium]|nr:glycoside hydrolase family 97 protein [Bacteroidota bacterium]
MKKSIYTILAAFSGLLMMSNVLYADEYKLLSPDGKIRLEVNTDDKVAYAVYYGERMIISPSQISLHTERHGGFGIKPGVKSVKRRSVDQLISPVVRQKSAEVRDHFNELSISFKGKYSLIFRAYDEGVAYRWESSIKDELIVLTEEASFSFPDNYLVFFPEEERLFTHQEREYLYIPLEEITFDRFSSIPLLVDVSGGPKVLITEADLQDYPGMYLQGDPDAFTLRGKFPRFVLEEEKKNDRDIVPVKRADYIAKVNGERTFPWRVIAIAGEDKELLANQMVFLLSEPCKIEDPSWIKPGKVAWDWWNFNNIYGVNFEAGINTETYKYYIDFAAANNIDYIILDEGWYELGDLTEINQEINMEELLAYGKEKGVGIILWVIWKTLDDQLGEVMPLFEEWSIAGLKIDFMQRDDQWMVDYYWRIAEEAATRKFLIDFHGSYKPAGLHRTWPNVITREGVRGMEWCKWSDKATPEMAVTLPFIRMFAGPMDYTPGAMLNATKEDFEAIFATPMSQGTRAQQLAMYVVFESPLQMLADNPTHYMKEAECMQFLSKVPVVWDETVVLDGKVGDFVVVARRNGYEWYIGAMTDWDARELEIDLSFLGDRKFEATIWKDGPNAHRNAQDFIKESIIVDKNTKLEIKLAPGGGWACILSIVKM